MPCRIYCGASEEQIRSTVTSGDNIIVYGAGSNFTLTKEFVDILLSLNITISKITLENMYSVGKEAFRYVKYKRGSTTWIEFDLGDMLETIEEYAFAQTNVIRSIVIPKSCKRIKNCAFFAADKLRVVKFEVDEEDYSSNLEYIGMSAFQDAKTLDTVRCDPSPDSTGNFPEGLKVIDAYAFARTTSLNPIMRFPVSLETLGAYAFAWSKICGFLLENGLNKRSGSLPTYGDLAHPHHITLCSKRQFRYFHVNVTEEINRIELPEEFVTCVRDEQFMVFLNGRLVPHGSVMSRPVDGTPLYKYEIYIDTPNAQSGDSLDIFYIPEMLTSLNGYVENIRQYKPPEDEIEGIIESYENLKPYDYLPADQKGFIKLNTPLYNVSSKNAMFVFVNGRKVDIDHIEDISTATMRITKFIQPPEIDEEVEEGETPPEEKRYPIQLLSFEDNYRINSFVFCKDGLSHSPDQVNIVPFEALESYNKLSILDKMLYNLPIDKLEILFNDPDNPIEELDEPNALGVRYGRDIIVQRLYNINKREGDETWWYRLWDNSLPPNVQ